MCPGFEFHAKIPSSSIRCTLYMNKPRRIILFAHNSIIFAIDFFFVDISTDISISTVDAIQLQLKCI